MSELSKSATLSQTFALPRVGGSGFFVSVACLLVTLSYRRGSEVEAATDASHSMMFPSTTYLQRTFFSDSIPALYQSLAACLGLGLLSFRVFRTRATFDFIRQRSAAEGHHPALWSIRRAAFSDNGGIGRWCLWIISTTYGWSLKPT